MDLREALSSRSPAPAAYTALQSARTDVLRGRADEVQARIETLVDGSVLKSMAGDLAGASDRFLDALGPSASAGVGPGTILEQLEGSAGVRSRNPLDNQRSPFIGAPGARVSDGDEKESTGLWDSVKNFFSSVFGSAAGNPAASTTVGNGAGAVAGTAFGILTANTDSPESKRNEAEGIIGLFRQGATGTSNREAAATLKEIDGELTPNPEADEGGSPALITNEQIEAIAARIGSRSEYLDEGTGSGPVDEQATPAGTLNQLGQWAPDMGVTAAVFTKYDAKALDARINGDKLQG